MEFTVSSMVSKSVAIILSMVLAVTIHGEEIMEDEIIEPNLVDKNIIDEILKLVNNNTAADELINTVYSEYDLHSQYLLSEVMQWRPPECVRRMNGGKYNGGVYFIYKYGQEDYLFV
jgi:hypothetical protein